MAAIRKLFPILARLRGAAAAWRNSRNPQAGRQSMLFELFEARILHSADLGAGIVGDAHAMPQVEQRVLESTGEFEPGSSLAEQTRELELVFIDAATPDYQSLLQDIAAQAGERRTEVILLDGDRDGIDQITEALAGRHDVAAVHLISHGSDGAVQLGNSILDSSTLDVYSARIEGWGGSLAQSADILIYGCNVAASSSGQALVTALAGLTGADVAASDDLTGSQARGGDWQLEYAAGRIETGNVVTAQAQAQWAGLLANSSPVLAGANNLDGVNEDPASNPGTLVSALIAGQVTDADGGPQGIAVIGADNTNGTWQYSTNSGGSWSSFGNPSATNARLLAADGNTYVRFVPNADWNGTVTNGLTFRAWDQSSGTAGATADTTETTSTVLDTFNATPVTYTGNDGTANWNGGWIDSGDGSPAGGAVSISGQSMRLQTVLLAGATSIYRSADLTGASSATLTLDYDNQILLSVLGDVSLQISGNGGGSYTTLATFSSGSTTGNGTLTFNIDGFISADTRVQLVVSGGITVVQSLFVDNIQIEYTLPLSSGMTAFSSATASSSITVAPVNDAPVGASKTVTTAEDTAYVFTAADFGFTDPHDSPANALLAVKITTLPGAGTLTINGVAVTGGDVVAFADISAGLLAYTPPADVAGAGTGSFTFQVQDNGGGADLDTVARTMTVDVTPVNDAPVGTSNTVATTEDTAYVFTAADFGYSDPDDVPANALLAVKVTTLPASGTLTVNGIAVTTGSFVSAADVNAGLLVYTPPAGAAGTGIASFTFQVQDNGGGADLDTVARTMTLDVTAVNDPPAGTSNTVATAEDTPYVFTAADFGFSDPGDVPANALLAVRMTTLPGSGTLTVNGIAVTAGDLVAVADIDAGLLVYAPPAGSTGAGTGSFTFQVQDNGGGTDLDTIARTMTIDVTSVNDAPAGSDGNVTATEDTPYIFTAADFGFSDPGDVPANTLLAVKITTLPVAGALTLNGLAVATGQFISIADVNAGNLAFTPGANANGAGYATLRFQVQDSGGITGGGIDLDPTPRTLTIDVTAANDPPAGANRTITITEDTGHTFTAADFGFSDPGDIPANALFSVKINTLPGAGTLTLNGVAVNAGDFVGVADINAGLLAFTPVADANGAGYAMFSFQVQDDGGGTNLALAANTISIDVTAVNDAPVLTNNNGVTISEGGSATIDAGMLHVSDADNTLVQLTYAVGVPALNGHLELTGAPGISISSFTQDDIAGNRLVYVHDGSETTTDSFSFSVSDGTGGNIGSTAFSITVNAVNDAPSAAAPGAQSTASNTALVLSSANGNALTVGDLDAGASPVEITISVVNGTLTLSGTTGLSFTTGSGSGDISMTFTGSIAAINTALDGLAFMADSGYAGSTLLSFIVDDLGNTGSGGALTAGGSVAIAVAAPPVPPVPGPPFDPGPGGLDGPVGPPVVTSPQLPPPGDYGDLPPAASGGETAEDIDDNQAPGGSPAEETASDTAAGSTPAVRAAQNALLGSSATGSTHSGRGSNAAFGAADLRLLLAAADQPEITSGEFSLASMESSAPDTSAQSALDSQGLMKELDRLREGMQEESRVDFNTVALTTAASLGLSVGYVLWLLRGGILVSSVLSSLPAWRFVDPLPILGRLEEDDEDNESDESLESMVVRGNRAAQDDEAGAQPA